MKGSDNPVPGVRLKASAAPTPAIAESQTATRIVTVLPGAKPVSVPIAPGPPVADGFQVPGKEVVEARNGDGAKDLVSEFAEGPYQI